MPDTNIDKLKVITNQFEENQGEFSPNDTLEVVFAYLHICEAHHLRNDKANLTKELQKGISLFNSITENYSRDNKVNVAKFVSSLLYTKPQLFSAAESIKYYKLCRRYYTSAFLQTGDKTLSLFIINMLAAISKNYLETGDIRQAKDYYSEAIQKFRQLDIQPNIQETYLRAFADLKQSIIKADQKLPAPKSSTFARFNFMPPPHHRHECGLPQAINAIVALPPLRVR